MPEDVIIHVDNLSKNFILPHEQANSVKSLFTGAVKKHDRKKEIQHALKSISFDIKKGEFFGIVGRNGSGKSTLLKILAGIYQPTNGQVKTYGKLVPFIELGVGFNPELTGRENVYLNGAMLGFSQKEVDAMYDSIVEFAELERFMDQKLKNYSSGMQVRLAFSVATQAQADILLVDEVLAVGDADFQRKCFDYFRELKKSSTTIIFVTHDMNAMREFCDRAILIEEGIIQHEGLAHEVADSYIQMFAQNSKTENKDLAATKDRWGDGAVKIKKTKLNKKVATASDTALELEVEIQAYRKATDLISGFTVKNSIGQSLNGTHTLVENVALPDLDVNQTCKLLWKFLNVYEDGIYTIDVFVFNKENVIHDSWRRAVVFQVKRGHLTGNLVYPLPSVKIIN